MAREYGERRQEFLMRRLLARFVDDECGATAIEYCLIAAGISIVIVTAVNGVGSMLSTKFVDVSTSIK
jgi:pilus assembly protein Flp/PilA